MNDPLALLPKELAMPHSFTCEELHNLYSCSKSTLYRKIAPYRKIIGKPTASYFRLDQVILIFIVCGPPDDYYVTYQWLERNGIIDSYRAKYKIETHW
jgi:hypothetical protein